MSHTLILSLNLDFLSSTSSTFGNDILTPQGHIIVRNTLQLPDYPNIFALGDAIDFPEQKQAAKAGRHLRILMQNIPAFIDGRRLKEYTGTPEMIAVTNGKVDFVHLVFCCLYNALLPTARRGVVHWSFLGNCPGRLDSLVGQVQDVVSVDVQTEHGTVIYLVHNIA